MSREVSEFKDKYLEFDPTGQNNPWESGAESDVIKEVLTLPQ